MGAGSTDPGTFYLVCLGKEGGGKRSRARGARGGGGVAWRQVMTEHIETDVRVRLGIAPADAEWREDQVPRSPLPLAAAPRRCRA